MTTSKRRDQKDQDGERAELLVLRKANLKKADRDVNMNLDLI